MGCRDTPQFLLSERESISQRKSKTTEAVANRGVDADAPRGENEDQKKRRKLQPRKSIRGNPYAEIRGIAANLRKERKTSRCKKKERRLLRKLKRKGLSSIRLIW